MKVLNYLSSLLPKFSRNRVIDDIEITKGEIISSTLPAYEIALPLLKNFSFKSAELKRDEETLRHQIGGRDNLVVAIHKGLKNSQELLDDLAAQVPAMFGDTITASGLTYLRANLLQLIELIGFFNRYSRKYLNYIYALETEEVDKNTVVGRLLIVPAEEKWLRANFLSYMSALKILHSGKDVIGGLLKAIPDIAITKSNAETLEHTKGTAAVDPLGFNFLPLIIHPAYHIGLLWSEWQAKRYKEAQEEYQLLQLRKLLLQRAIEKKPDPKLENEIRKITSRINEYSHKIAEMEKKYA